MSQNGTGLRDGVGRVLTLPERSHPTSVAWEEQGSVRPAPPTLDLVAGLVLSIPAYGNMGSGSTWWALHVGELSCLDQ